jgi:DNA polymerase III sliding clamp (beta) subunit (PCNA family)
MELLKPAVATKKAVVKITAYAYFGEGKATATDLESMIIVNMPEAKEPILLPYSAISAMLKYIPSVKMLKIEQKGKLVSITWDGGSASYPTEDPAEFYLLPDLPTRAESLIDGDTLIAAMKAALPYVAPPAGKGQAGNPVLEGITLVLGSPIEIAAGDSFRASIQVMGLTFPKEEKVILPARSVATLEHVFSKTPRTPPVNAASLVQAVTAKRNLRMSLVGDNKLRLDYGTNASVIINLVSGKPPEWMSLLPTAQPIFMSHLFAPQLEAAVKRVQAIAKDGSNMVRLEFAEGKLKVSSLAKDQEISSVVETINTQGEPSRLGINVKYLLEFVSGKQGIFTFTRYTDTSPVLFEYNNSPKVLIMPMRVDWESQDNAPEKTKKTKDEAPKGATNETAEEEADNETGEEEATGESDEEVTAENTAEEPAAEATE